VLTLGISGCTSLALQWPDFSPAWHPLAKPAQSHFVVGMMLRHEIEAQETLLDLTRPNDLGYVELVAANPGVDPWLPAEGSTVILPTAHLLPGGKHEGIVINLAEQRLYYFDATEDGETLSFPIGVSREGWETPLGETRVVRKRVAPTWYPTASARREDPTLGRSVGPGPDNPLGTHALYLDWPTYLIHGTNEPDGVGRRVSRGCIRLYPEDIIRLFEAAPIDTPVRVIHDPVKLARVGDDIFLEVHPTIDEMKKLEEDALLDEIEPEDLRARIQATAGDTPLRIDWGLAYQTAAQRRGIPVRITR
jgi:L,D-transpeptidase ErfK/SrfK